MDESQIDLCSSNNSTPCMLQQVSVPLLAAANQASFQNLIQEVEINYLYANSADKDFIVVEGATTGVTPCTNCANPATSYANVTKNFFDYAAKWINDRFSSN
jgi:dethiobiotin synthetase